MNSTIRSSRRFFTLASILPVLATSTLAAPGDLDSSFGTGGKVTTPVGSSVDVGRSVAVQGDGKIVVAGYSYNGTDHNFALVRSTSTGSLDASFGSGGKVTTAIGTFTDIGYSVAVQNDGKIVVAGYSYNGSRNADEFALVRYHAGGSLDSNFGSGGKVTTPLRESAQARAVTVQSDGKIVVVGHAYNGSNWDIAVCRYTATGALDLNFGGGTGQVFTPVGFLDDIAFSVAMQSDGRIVVAGRSGNGSNDDFALVRYTSTGDLDTSFDTDGKVTTPIGSSSEEAVSVAVQSDGKIAVAGQSYNGNNYDFALVRYTSSGALDTSFGSGGKVTTPVGTSNDYARGMAVQADGKIIVAGHYWAPPSNENDFAVVRYTSAGALDANFGTGGKVVTPVGSGIDQGEAVVLQTDGKIVVAGSAGFPANDFAVVRYEGLPITNQAGVVNQTNLLIAPTAGGSESYYNNFDMTLSGRTAVGESGYGILNHSTGLHSTPSVEVGNLAGSTGVYNHSGGALNASTRLFVGLAGGGTYDQLGGTVTTPSVRIGGGGPVAIFKQRGGGLTVNGDLTVGRAGVGAIEHSSGTVSATTLNVADLDIASGTYTLSGGTLNVSTDGDVGHDGSGIFNQTGGTATIGNVLSVGFNSGSIGTFNHSAGTLGVTGGLYLGKNAGSTGTFNLNGTGAVTSPGNIEVGRAGTGIFSQSGGSVQAARVFLGVDGSATGTYTLTGGSVTATTDFVVGRTTSGTVNHSGGTVTTPSLGLGDFLATSIGTYNLSGTGVLDAEPGAINVGQRGVGNLNQTGGQLMAGTVRVGDLAGSDGTFTLNGGTATIGQLESGAGARAVTLSKGTITVGGTNLNLTAGALVLGNGTDVATLNLGNGTHIIANGIRVKSNAVLNPVGSQAGTVTVALEGGTLTGDASQTLGSLTATSGSAIDPGLTGTTTVHLGSVQLAGGVTYFADLTGASGSDQLNSSGTVALGGATLTLRLRFAPVGTQSFTIVQKSGAGAVTGTFAGLPEGATFNLTNTGAGGGTFPAAITYQGGDGNDVVVTLNPVQPPEIVVEQPVGMVLIDNASTVNFGTSPVGTAAPSKTFRIGNTGGSPLTGVGVTFSGSHASDFAPSFSGVTVAAGGTHMVFVTFNPSGPGPRAATMLIASNDADENPFEVALTGQGLSFTADTDSDGLNDAAEYQMAALGFDWQTTQTSLVNTLYTHANSANLYTPAQVQAIHVGTPLIQRDPATGTFTLILKLRKTTTLSPANWQPFSFTEDTFLNGQGELEFDFTVPDNAAFFRLEAR